MEDAKARVMAGGLVLTVRAGYGDGVHAEKTFM